MLALAILASCAQKNYKRKKIVTYTQEKQNENIKIGFVYEANDTKKDEFFIKSLHLIAKENQNISFHNKLLDQVKTDCDIIYNRDLFLSSADNIVNISPVKTHNEFNLGISAKVHIKSLCIAIRRQGILNIEIISTEEPEIMRIIATECEKKNLLVLRSVFIANKQELIREAKQNKSTVIKKNGKVIKLDHRQFLKLKDKESIVKEIENIQGTIFIGKSEDFSQFLDSNSSKKIFFLTGIDTQAKETLSRISSNKEYFYHGPDAEIITSKTKEYKQKYNEKPPIIYPILKEAVSICKGEFEGIISDAEIENKSISRTFKTYVCIQDDCN